MKIDMPIPGRHFAATSALSLRILYDFYLVSVLIAVGECPTFFFEESTCLIQYAGHRRCIVALK